MLIRKFISFASLLLLLLLSSYAVVGKASSSDQSPVQKTENLYTSKTVLHVNMLQQQVTQIVVVPEHLGKLVYGGVGLVPFGIIATTINRSLITSNGFLQDVNRCESVSLLLFPYHIFW